MLIKYIAAIIVAVSILMACSEDKKTIERNLPANAIGEEKHSSAEAVAVKRTAGYNPNRNVYFGDLHIHTANSFDAYIFNVRATPDDAYRFAKGETIKHPAGFDMTIAGGPLDFYAVTDHGAYMGILESMNTPGTSLNEQAIAKEMFSDNPLEALAAFGKLAASVRSGKPVESVYDQSIMDSAWARNVEVAEKHNDPGVFTTFSAYEYSSVSVDAGNLHRNVIFKNAAPAQIFSTLHSINAEDLWDWMDRQREAGFESLAIPHNSNISNGWMFKLETYNGEPLSAQYAAQRLRNEPLVEVTQVKGTSETHPVLSPNDEWSDFGIFEKLLDGRPVSRFNGSYVRETYRSGLVLQEREGYDPFRFGMVAASDSHVAGGAYAENDYWSKIGIIDGTPANRGSIPRGEKQDWSDEPKDQLSKTAAESLSKWGASGLTGVWAEENTRDSLFAAFRRKETFATTGPRIKVRFFAGFDYGDDIENSADLTRLAYEGGVPMGGDLLGRGDEPAFIVWAQRDPNGSLLQRVQVVKVTADGEQVYDAACHQGEPDSTTHRCLDNQASVDLTTCTPSGEGAVELKKIWRDPDFKAERRATYYVRVLENPSCRWTTWEALKNGTPPRPDVPPTIQERAYTSPIWYIPPQ